MAFLTVRMVLYFLFGAISGTGVGIHFDPATGLVSFTIDTLANLIVGAIGFVGTFAVSRVAKAKRWGST